MWNIGTFTLVAIKFAFKCKNSKYNVSPEYAHVNQRFTVKINKDLEVRTLRASTLESTNHR